MEESRALTLLPVTVYIYTNGPWQDDQTLWIQACLTLQESCFTSRTVAMIYEEQTNIMSVFSCKSSRLGIKPSIRAVFVSCASF